MLKRFHNLLYPNPDGTTASSAQLESQGHLLLREVFSPSELRTLRTDILRVYAEYPPDQRSDEASPEFAAMFRYEIFNRSQACLEAIQKPAILDTIEPLLGNDCHVIANTAWKNPPQTPNMPMGQNWHIDYGPHVPREEGVSWPDNIPYPVFVIGTHIYLDPVRMEDGPFAAIPTSHTSGRVPPGQKHWDQHLEYNGHGPAIHLAEPGDVSFFVSDVWHRRMPYTEHSAGRFFLQTNYGRRDIAQRIRPTSQVNHLSPEIDWVAGTMREKRLVGLHPPLFYDG